MEDSKYIFHAKTSEAHIIKSMVDCLKLALKTNVKMQINKDGMFVRQPNKQNTLMVEVNLDRKEFDRNYEFNQEEDLHIGLDLESLQKLLKQIKKKKDLIELFIEKKNKNRMWINIHSPSKQSYFINIFYTERVIEKDISDQFEYPKLITSSEYQKTIKSLVAISSDVITIKIQSSKYVGFFLDNNLKTVGGNNEHGESNESEPIYEIKLAINNLKKTAKLSQLSNNIKIYAPTNLTYPAIKISTKAGGLGNVSIYIKSIDYNEINEIN